MADPKDILIKLMTAALKPVSDPPTAEQVSAAMPRMTDALVNFCDGLGVQVPPEGTPDRFFKVLNKLKDSQIYKDALDRASAAPLGFTSHRARTFFRQEVESILKKKGMDSATIPGWGNISDLYFDALSASGPLSTYVGNLSPSQPAQTTTPNSGYTPVPVADQKAKAVYKIDSQQAADVVEGFVRDFIKATGGGKIQLGAPDGTFDEKYKGHLTKILKIIKKGANNNGLETDPYDPSSFREWEKATDLYYSANKGQYPDLKDLFENNKRLSWFLYSLKVLDADKLLPGQEAELEKQKVKNGGGGPGGPDTTTTTTTVEPPPALPSIPASMTTIQSWLIPTVEALNKNGFKVPGLGDAQADGEFGPGSNKTLQAVQRILFGPAFLNIQNDPEWDHPTGDLWKYDDFRGQALRDRWKEIVSHLDLSELDEADRKALNELDTQGLYDALNRVQNQTETDEGYVASRGIHEVEYDEGKVAPVPQTSLQKDILLWVPAYAGGVSKSAASFLDEMAYEYTGGYSKTVGGGTGYGLAELAGPENAAQVEASLNSAVSGKRPADGRRARYRDLLTQAYEDTGHDLDKMEKTLALGMDGIIAALPFGEKGRKDAYKKAVKDCVGTMRTSLSGGKTIDQAVSGGLDNLFLNIETIKGDKDYGGPAVYSWTKKAVDAKSEPTHYMADPRIAAGDQHSSTGSFGIADAYVAYCDLNKGRVRADHKPLIVESKPGEILLFGMDQNNFFNFAPVPVADMEAALLKGDRSIDPQDSDAYRLASGYKGFDLPATLMNKAKEAKAFQVVDPVNAEHRTELVMIALKASKQQMPLMERPVFSWEGPEPVAPVPDPLLADEGLKKKVEKYRAKEAKNPGQSAAPTPGDDVFRYLQAQKNYDARKNIYDAQREEYIQKKYRYEQVEKPLDSNGQLIPFPEQEPPPPERASILSDQKVKEKAEKYLQEKTAYDQSGGLSVIKDPEIAAYIAAEKKFTEEQAAYTQSKAYYDSEKAAYEGQIKDYEEGVFRARNIFEAQFNQNGYYYGEGFNPGAIISPEIDESKQFASVQYDYKNIIAAYNGQNAGKMRYEHQPLIFNQNGKTYIAGIEQVSNIMTVQEIDLAAMTDKYANLGQSAQAVLPESPTSPPEYKVPPVDPAVDTDNNSYMARVAKERKAFYETAEYKAAKTKYEKDRADYKTKLVEHDAAHEKALTRNDNVSEEMAKAFPAYALARMYPGPVGGVEQFLEQAKAARPLSTYAVSVPAAKESNQNFNPNAPGGIDPLSQEAQERRFDKYAQKTAPSKADQVVADYNSMTDEQRAEKNQERLDHLRFERDQAMKDIHAQSRPILNRSVDANGNVRWAVSCYLGDDANRRIGDLQKEIKVLQDQDDVLKNMDADKMAAQERLSEINKVLEAGDLKFKEKKSYELERDQKLLEIQDLDTKIAERMNGPRYAIQKTELEKLRKSMVRDIDVTEEILRLEKDGPPKPLKFKDDDPRMPKADDKELAARYNRYLAMEEANFPNLKMVAEAYPQIFRDPQTLEPTVERLWKSGLEQQHKDLRGGGGSQSSHRKQDKKQSANSGGSQSMKSDFNGHSGESHPSSRNGKVSSGNGEASHDSDDEAPWEEPMGSQRFSRRRNFERKGIFNRKPIWERYDPLFDRKAAHSLNKRGLRYHEQSEGLIETREALESRYDDLMEARKDVDWNDKKSVKTWERELERFRQDSKPFSEERGQWRENMDQWYKDLEKHRDRNDFLKNAQDMTDKMDPAYEGVMGRSPTPATQPGGTR
ncbi:MAG: hypothetical protein K9G62_03670 [Alphaproteobacteria bacterium]|nr:hypothetical protein [Alphaproteobacteria bacterium]